MNAVTVFAPATVANVAVGFDILGFAIEQVGDTVTAEKTENPGVVSVSLTGPTSIPTDPDKNTASVAVQSLLGKCQAEIGIKLSIKKGIPLSSGMGGSAASSVAAVVAANELLHQPFDRTELLEFALDGENVASGNRHADNVAPCLLGGLTLVRSLSPPDIIAVPHPGELLCVLVHPKLEIATRDARTILAPNVPLRQVIEQMANLAGFLLGCTQKDLGLVGRSLSDVIIEPQRAHLIPGFAEAKFQALKTGALGFSISGSGPSLFALVVGFEKAKHVRDVTLEALRRAGVECDGSWISPISTRGARVV